MSSSGPFVDEKHLSNRRIRTEIFSISYFIWSPQVNVIRVELLLHLTEVRDYCPWERFNATCRQPSEVILMTSALYGRMRYGRCVKERHGSEGCATDVLRYLDGLCSGRYRCQLEIPDAHLHKAQPCPRELMSYLEASYYCVPGIKSVSKYINFATACTLTMPAWSLVKGGERR